MQLSITILLSALCALGCAKERQKRMVGGEFASRTSFPSLVLVRRRGYQCSGTIISPSWVLTAAHCVVNASPVRFKITAGTVSDWDGGDENDIYVQHRRVSRIVAHESYRRFTNDSIDTTFYDIGLIQLKKPFILTKYVNVVPLSQSRPPYPRPCFAVGFGLSTISPQDWEKLKEDPTYAKRVKRSEPLRFYKLGDAQPEDYGPMPCRVLRDLRFKEIYQLCSIGGAPNTTHLYSGDSGGPMVCKGEQVGVYTLSEPKMYNGSLHIIEVHTAVHHFIDWIKAIVFDLQLHTTTDMVPLDKQHPSSMDVFVFPNDEWQTRVDKATAFPIIEDPLAFNDGVPNVRGTGNKWWNYRYRVLRKYSVNPQVVFQN